MESRIIKSLVVLGVPGVALGVFYLLLNRFGFQFSEIGPTWAAVIAIIFLIIVGAITAFALHIFAPASRRNITHDDNAERAKILREKWLEKALEHTEKILRHIQATRTEAIQEGGLMHPEKIDEAILRSLTSEYTPEELKKAVENLPYDELKKFFTNVQEAFMAIRIAQMDLAHGAKPASEEYEPTYVVQWYTTQLMNFESEASRILAGN